MPIVLNGTTGITTPTYNGNTTAEYLVPVTGFKNRIINGAMMINQRGFSGSVTTAGISLYTLDRWQCIFELNDKFTVSQNAGSVTPPAGFINYLGITSSAATTISSTNYFGLNQKIEGLNIADLDWGTANAKAVTVSFWVRSSLTGAFGGSVTNSTQAYSYPFSYTISAANTWEQKTISIVGPTSGTWLTTNATGLILTFNLGYGSTYAGTAGTWASAAYYTATGTQNLLATNGATLYITGVQLEVGSTATSFDYRPYGTELALCQRYFYQTSRYLGLTFNSDTYYGPAITFPVTMRATPTLNSGATFTARSGSNGVPAISTGVTGIFASADGVYTYNSSSNWSTNAQLSITAGFTAEL
jgi:hypothetical protein